MGAQTQLIPSHVKYGLSVAAGFLAFGILHRLSTVTRGSRREPLRSPQRVISASLSQEEIDNLPYPPDIFPGGRDVETPYGSIRLFEWGPEDGGKVLLVHGISTPAMSLGGLAEKLVQKGCRVMLFGTFCSSIERICCSNSLAKVWHTKKLIQYLQTSSVVGTLTRQLMCPMTLVFISLRYCWPSHLRPYRGLGNPGFMWWVTRSAAGLA